MLCHKLIGPQILNILDAQIEDTSCLVDLKEALVNLSIQHLTIANEERTVNIIETISELRKLQY